MTKVIDAIKSAAIWISKKIRGVYAAEWTVVILGVLNILADKRTTGLVVAGLGVFYLINALTTKG